ncbi:uncharacterized protein PG998_004583 [Apiospora kogelbergensis]|uniref:uncharacterized protein n=1 Tax=Apiospora kogelbergensis TaxID=1337665 RepID=UPI00312DF2D9
MSSQTPTQREKDKAHSNAATTTSQDQGPTTASFAKNPPSQTQQHATSTAQAGTQGYQMSRWLQESGKDDPWTPRGQNMPK